LAETGGGAPCRPWCGVVWCGVAGQHEQQGQPPA
jgi:hypothetical protein